MILHHHPFLPACRFIRLALDEHGVRASLVTEAFWEAPETLVAVNPGLTLPMAYDGERGPIIGAVPVMEYLDERFGAGQAGHRLFPADALARAEVRRLVMWFLEKFEAEVAGPMVHERLMKVEMPSAHGGGAPDSAALRVARQNLLSHLSYLDEVARGRNWLAGDALSFADLAGAASLSCVDYLGEISWEADGALRAWYQRIKSRPSFRPLLADKARRVPAAAHYHDLDF